MRVTFIGAAQCVTGSCTLLTYNDFRILIDCGLAQGQDSKSLSLHFPIDESAITHVLLTHAHIDHCGRLPLLEKRLFKGKIICTNATKDLCSIILSDCAKIQESDAKWQSKKLKKKIEPLYSSIDANNVLKRFETVNYNQKIKLSDTLEIIFLDAGHMIGSSTIVLNYKNESNEFKTIVFSGDIGSTNRPIVKDPDTPQKADYVVMESTYGNKLHSDKTITTEMLSKNLEKIIDETFLKGGKVIIPAFAVGRSQEILYLIRDIISRTKKKIPTYLDSPMSVRATKVFIDNAKECYDQEALDIINSGKNPILFSQFEALTTTEESKKLNEIKESSVIIASSGMCEAGRIVHHLKNNLEDEKNTIVFTGYQAEGTLGRRLLSGKKKVKIFNQYVSVKAQIVKLSGISAHADRNLLTQWLDNYAEKPHKVFVVHGDKKTCTGFSEYLKTQKNYDAIAPRPNESFEL